MAVTVRPVAVVVAPMSWRMVSWLVRGLPRQLRVIWENSRCSIWGEMQPAPPVSRQVVLGSELVSLPDGSAVLCGYAGGFWAGVRVTWKPSRSSWETR